MRLKRMALLAVIAAGMAEPAHALTIDFVTKQGDTLTNAQADAFRLAAAAWSAVLKDDVTLSIEIGFAQLGDRVLGSTSSYIAYEPSALAKRALDRDAKTAVDAQATASLPANPQGYTVVTTAEAKALGLAPPSSADSDGTIEFSSTFAFSTTRNAQGGIAAGTYDLVGIAEHEIGHLLGFDSGVDANNQYMTMLDWFRYGAPGDLSLAKGVPAYFSLDGGRTALASFSDGVQDQAGHWHGGTLSDGQYAVMNPEVGAGVTRNITKLDITALDAIGWDAVSSVPLPGSAPLFGAALLAFGVFGAAFKSRASARAL